MPEGVDTGRGAGLLPWIAAERAVRALLLLALGIVLITHAQANWGHVVAHVARSLGLDPASNGIHRLIIDAHRLSPRRVEVYGAVAIGYAVLEGAEAWGLWRRRRWGEYLTVAATSLLFIPEIWELVKKPSALKAGGIVVNALIVAYLVRRLRRRR